MSREYRSEFCPEHGVWVLKRLERDTRGLDAAQQPTQPSGTRPPASGCLKLVQADQLRGG